MSATKLTGLLLAAIITGLAAYMGVSVSVIFIGWCIVIYGYMAGGEN